MKRVSALVRKFVGHFSLLWNRRQQDPQENGLADISTVHVVTITQAEENSMHIDKNEYDQTDWFDWKRIRNDDKERYHPALKQAVNDWATSQIYDDLKEYCQRPDAKDEVIAKMAKSLVGRRGEVEEVTLVHFHTGDGDVEGDGRYSQMPWQKRNSNSSTVFFFKRQFSVEIYNFK